jgi:hypothetical protein
MTQPGLHYRSISFRGSVSPGKLERVAIAWLDVHEHLIGQTVSRLPDGDGGGLVRIERAIRPPSGAVCVGVGIGVQNQVDGDWIEVRDFRLRAN